jgi:hypothetical protein
MMLVEQMAGAIAGAPLRGLDELSRKVWQAMLSGLLTDDEAQGLAEAIHARRASVRAGALISADKNQTAVRAWSYFPPKRPQRSPDRERSMQRRRQLAASGPMPPALAAHFTTGELAVLRIVADEVRRWGACGLSIPEISARAGVGQTKARMAIREAERLGLVTIQERRQHCRPNLPNVVQVISREWLVWIARSPVPGRRINSPLLSCQEEGSHFQRPRSAGFQKKRRCPAGLPEARGSTPGSLQQARKAFSGSGVP